MTLNTGATAKTRLVATTGDSETVSGREGCLVHLRCIAAVVALPVILVGYIAIGLLARPIARFGAQPLGWRTAARIAECAYVLATAFLVCFATSYVLSGIWFWIAAAAISGIALSQGAKHRHAVRSMAWACDDSDDTPPTRPPEQ